MTFLNSLLNNSKEHSYPFQHWELNMPLSSEAIKETSEARYIQELEESTLDITHSYNPNHNSEFVGGLLKLVWGVILCIAPFILIAMTDGMFIWWGLWIWGGIEILVGLSKMFGD